MTAAALGAGKRKRHNAAPARLRLPLISVLAVWVVLGLFVLWSAMAQIDRVVRAEGRIVPDEMPQFVQHLEGGVVSRVFVTEGDRIEKGAPIANVSDIEAEAVVNERQLRIAALRAEAHRLEAESLELEPDWSVFEYSHETSDFVRQQQELYRARATTLSLTLGSLEAQLSQKLAEIREITQRVEGFRSELEIAEQQMSVVQRMVDKEAGSRLELLDAMSRVAQFKTQMSELESTLPRLGYQVDELRQRQEETRAEFTEGALLRLSEVRLEIDQLNEEIAAATDRLRRTVLVSPVDGVVNRVFARTVGGVLRPGDPVAEITPDSQTLIVEGWIDPAERASVLPGLHAIVRISAYDFAVHGTLKGEVVEVSADTVERENQLRQYRVRIRIDGESYEAFGRPVSPGMIATADVVIGERTVLQYLISPLTRGLSTALRDRK